MNKNWPEEVQDTIYSLLQKPQVGLPQEESLFSIYHINNDLFKGDFTRRANIVYIDVNASYTEAECKMEKNPWSKPQIYAHICAPTKEAAITCLAAIREKISYSNIPAPLKGADGTGQNAQCGTARLYPEKIRHSDDRSAGIRNRTRRR